MTAAQMKAARALLGMTQAQIASASGVSLPTVKRIEAGADAKASTMNALRAALEAAGVQFIVENGGGAGVRLARR